MKNQLFLLTFLMPFSILAQEIYFNNQIEGYWTGALVRGGNSVQLMTAEFYQENDTLMVATSIPDWAYYPPYISKVKQTNLILEFETYYGGAKMFLDTTYLEMIGTNRQDIPAVNLHLKKSLKPYTPSITERDIVFDAGDIQLNGKIILPNNKKEKVPCAIIVHGRGCSTKDWGVERGRLLAKYGLAVVAFDKRGSKNTNADCNATTLTDHVRDLTKIIDRVQLLPEIDKENIGLIGYSAGGWVAPATAAKNKGKLNFMATVVGPSTGIKKTTIGRGKIQLRPVWII